MDIVWQILDNDENPITGASADTALKIRRGSDGFLYDFSDTTFKGSGWVNLTTILSEVDAVNLPGVYKATVSDGSWDDDWYQFIAVYDGIPRRVSQAEYVKTQELATWEIAWLVVDGDSEFVTGGAANTSVKVRRNTDGYLLDWDDLNFKSSGWTTLAPALTEVSAVNVPGLYHRTLDISAWNDGKYQVFASYDSITLTRRGQGEIAVADGYLELSGVVYIGVPGGEAELILSTTDIQTSFDFGSMNIEVEWDICD